MLWYTGAQIETVYAQTLDVRGYKYPDIGWTMYRFDSGAIGVCENVWFMPDKVPYFPDERMEIVGTEGSIHIQETYPSISVIAPEGAYTPDTTYWYEVEPGVRKGALADELNYFVTCIQNNTPPTIITPEQSLAATQACLAAEASATSGEVVKVPGFNG